MLDDSKNRYYLEIAETVARKSTCLRRKYGAVIVKNDEIIATGYNGSPRGAHNCNKLGYCLRNIVGSAKGDSYNLCLSVHAEMNAIISAARKDMVGSTLYIVGLNVDSEKDNFMVFADPSPCMLCERMIVNSGISSVIGFTGALNKPSVTKLMVNAHSFNKRILDNILRVYDETTDANKRSQISEYLNHCLIGEPENAKAPYLYALKGDEPLDGIGTDHGATGTGKTDSSVVQG